MGMKDSTGIPQQRKDKAERSTGPARRPRQVIGNGNQMTALRFHTGGRQSQPSFGGGGGREGAAGVVEAGEQKRLCIKNECGGTETEATCKKRMLCIKNECGGTEATCKTRMSDISLPHAYRDDS